MSFFEEAFDKVIIYEGGYANDPDDPGGETYKGIARRANPSWLGWKIIDAHKYQDGFPLSLNKDVELQQQVEQHYQDYYWDDVIADNLGGEIAAEVFEQSVHFGVGRAVRHLQSAVNILNNNQKLYKDIVVDGVLGQDTIAAARQCINKRGVRMLCNMLNGYQMKRYIEIMEAKFHMEKFIGWFSRVEIIK